MTPRDPAPLFVDAFRLCEWIVGRLGEDPNPVSEAVCRRALELLETVTLALKRRRTPDQLERADEALIVLRTHLRLAVAVGRLEDRHLEHTTRLTDAIGRQLGGWLRALDAA